MRTTEEIMNGLHVFYNPETESVFLVQDNYSHSVRLIQDTIRYASSIGLIVPGLDEIQVNILAGVRFKGCMSIEFKSATPPEKQRKHSILTKDSGLWEWLKY